jgi:hypothetical protein
MKQLVVSTKVPGGLAIFGQPATEQYSHGLGRRHLESAGAVKRKRVAIASSSVEIRKHCLP